MMMSAVFELKKLRADKLPTVLLILALCAAACFACLHASPNSCDKEETERILALFEASPEETYRLWEEKQQAYRDYLADETASGLPPFLSDYDSYRRAWELFSRQTRYHERLETVLRQTQEDGAVGVYMVSLYTRNQTLRLSHADMQSLPDLFDTLAFASRIAIPLSVLLGISLAYADRRRGMEQMLFACKNGRAHLRIAKLSAMGIYSACTCALLFAVSLLPFVLQGGFVSWDAYLQNHESFFVCPYPLTVWQAVLILFLLTWLGAFALGVTSCLIGKYVRHQAVSLLFAWLPVVFLIALSMHDFPDGRSLYGLISPFSFCDGSAAFGHLYGTRIGSFAVGGLPVAVCIWVLLCILLCAVYTLHHVPAVSAFPNKKRAVTLPSVRIPRFVRSVFAFEGAKQFLGNKAMLLLPALLLLFGIVVSSEITPDPSYGEQTYRAYMTKLGGTYTDEKQQLADDALAEAQSVLAQKQEMDALFARGELTSAEMSEYRRRFGNAQASERALLRVAERLAFVRANPQAEIVYDSGWNVLFSLDVHVFPALLICAVCCGLFADEYKQGMHRIFPTRARRRIATAKFLFALCFACVSAICFEAVQVGLTACRMDLALPFAPAASVPAAASFGGIPLVWSALLSVLYRTCLYAVISLVCTACSRVIRQKQAAFVCGVLCALLFLM